MLGGCQAAKPNKVIVPKLSGQHTFHNVLSHHLLEHGIGRHDVAIMYAYRGVDLVIVILGTCSQ